MRNAHGAIAALIVTVLLAAVVSTATAARLSISNQNIRATWTSLEFVSPGVLTVRCQLTLEGSFHTRTVAKVTRSLIGAVTKAQFKQESCTNGSFATFNGVDRYNGTTSPNTLPWHITYESFAGTLPNINAVNILLQRFRFGITVPGICTGQYGAETDRLSYSASLGASREVSALTPIEGRNSASLIRRDAGLACPPTQLFRAGGTVSLLGNTTRITITLI